MTTTTGAESEDKDNSLVQSTLNWIIEAGVNGFGVLPSAKKVASDHLKDAVDLDSAIESIINWRTAYAAGSGFVTGVGGIAAMPITIPAGLLVSFALGANTAAAIACVRGYDVNTEQVRTLILLTKAGEKGVVNVAKMVPLVGGVVGAGFDGYFVNVCGRAAQTLFSPE